MKRTVQSLVIAVLLALFVPAVAAAQNAYAAVRFGAGWTPATNDGRPGFEDPSEHKVGVTASGVVGFAWPSGLRIEGEFGFFRAPVKSDAGVPVGGFIKSYAPMVNVAYDARPAFLQPLKASVGFGLGAARVNHHDEFISSTGVKLQANESLTGFAWQVRAGIRYEINKRLGLSAGYRFLHIAGGHILQAPDQHQVNFDVVKNHSIEFGLGVKF